MSVHFTSSDRMGLMVAVSLVVHAIIVFGVVFTGESPEKEAALPTLEVILSQEESKQAPDEADYLAPTQQQGGGNVSERVRPTSPPPAPAASPLPGRGDVVSPPRQAAPQSAPALAVIASEAADAPVQRSEQTQSEPEAERPSAAELVMRSEQIARLSDELDQSLKAYSKRPRERIVTSQTRSFRDAAYLDAWREKIERIGNLNYPEEARRQHLSGNLVLNVALRPDGSLAGVELRHSSGYKVLDDAAVRIVKLAAPFAPFPPEMRKDTDILHITRAWQFLSGNRFASGE